MKAVLKKSIHICLIAVLLLTAVVGSGWAAGPNQTTGSTGGDIGNTGNSGGGTALEGELVPTGYTVDRSTIRKASTVKVTVQLKYADQSGTAIEPGKVDATRLVDSFSGGTIESSNIEVTPAGHSFIISIPVSGLVYGGSGNSLRLMVSIGGKYEQIEIPIKECVEYEEPTYEPVIPDEPDPISAPMALMSRNEMNTPMKAGETRTITIYVKNTGTTTMKSPLISFTPSDSLFLPGTSSTLQMNDIRGGKTESVEIVVRALDEITSVSQYLDMELKFRYYNLVSTVEGSSSGRVTIPAKLSKEKKKEPDKTVIDSPVPNLIITSFNYGGASVAAGSEFGLNFQFINTSSKLPVENVVVTLEGGEGFTINGATNTFYFEKIKAGGRKAVSVPMKVLADVKNGAQPVSVSFKYEYVDNDKRVPVSTDMKMTVPVYQPDRFEISHPTVPVMVYAGEETSITMNYVNKSKSSILNVEASLEGDVETYTPVQNLGNMEPGKSGTMSFAVTAWEAGEAELTITVTYEDGNGDTKTREFPVTLTVEEMVMEDPGMYDPMPEPEPEPQTNLKLIGAIAVAAVIVLLMIVKKKKKSAALKKEAEMWGSWDDDMELSDAAGVGAAGTDAEKQEAQK